MKNSDKMERFLSSYSGRTLLERHSMDEQGVWQVFGEDRNLDFGGPHYEPLIATYNGTLKNIIRIAVDTPAFWGYGSGRITKLNVASV